MTTSTHSSPVAIIAGNGVLPLEIAQLLTSKGQQIFVCAIADEASAELSHYPNERLEWGQIGRLFKLLKQQKVEQVVMAGGVVGRPDFQITKMDWGAMRTLPGLLTALLGGDNTILSSVIGVFEKRGFAVCSVADLAPELIAGAGEMSGTKSRPRAADLERIAEGRRLIAALGSFDVGQACVVLGSRAVAIEGAEGTDLMVRRVAQMREAGRLPSKRGGVLVKGIKSGQDERVDLPTIGPETVQQAYDAGLVGIGVEAGKAVVLQKNETFDLARSLGVFIYGFATGESDMAPV